MRTLPPFAVPLAVLCVVVWAASAEQCTLRTAFTGSWVQDTGRPIDASPKYWGFGGYRNGLCATMEPAWDCLHHASHRARLQRALRWRWSPPCSVAHERPTAEFSSWFLKAFAHKNIAFIGDDYARQAAYSLFCTLVRPESVQEKHGTERFKLVDTVHDLTASYVRSHFLVEHKGTGPQFDVDVSTVDAAIESAVHEVRPDIVVLGTGTWWKPSMLRGTYHTMDQVLEALSAALETAVSQLVAANPEVIIVVRSVEVPHHVNGEWDNGQSCMRFKDPITVLTQHGVRNMTFPFDLSINRLLRESMHHGLEMNAAYNAVLASTVQGIRRQHENVYFVDELDFFAPRADMHAEDVMHSPPDCKHYCQAGLHDLLNVYLFQSLAQLL